MVLVGLNGLRRVSAMKFNPYEYPKTLILSINGNANKLGPKASDNESPEELLDMVWSSTSRTDPNRACKCA